MLQRDVKLVYDKTEAVIVLSVALPIVSSFLMV